MVVVVVVSKQQTLCIWGKVLFRQSVQLAGALRQTDSQSVQLAGALRQTDSQFSLLVH